MAWAVIRGIQLICLKPALSMRVHKCRSASFATPAHVRKEWAEEHGLTAFQSSEFDAALQAVSKRLGVTTGEQHRS